MEDAFDLDPQDKPIYGAAAIGQVLGFTERQTYWHLEHGNLDAVVDKIGAKWTSTPRRLRSIATGSSKAANTERESAA